jgi:tetratricopeptide (TPR) repeat protein
MQLTINGMDSSATTFVRTAIGSPAACSITEIRTMLARVSVLFVIASCLSRCHAIADDKQLYRIDPATVDYLTQLPDDAYDQLISNDPSNPVLFYSRGMMCALKGELEDAVDDYDDAIRLDSNFAAAFAGRGFVLGMQGKLQQAIADFDECVRLAPSTVVAYHNRGLAYAESGNIRRAIKDIDLAILIGGTPEDYFIRGKLWFELDEFDRAIADYDAALLLDPGVSAKHFAARAAAWEAKGEYINAVVDLNSAITFNAKIPKYFTDRARLSMLLKQRDKAFDDLAKAIELDPQLAFSYCFRGGLRKLSGEIDQALPDLDKAIELDPRNSLAYEIRGEIRQTKGEFELSIADFTNAIKLDPNSTARYLAHRAVCFEKIGDLAKSMDDLNQLIRLEPKSANAYCLRGRLRLANGDVSRAYTDADLAFRLDPKLVDALVLRGQTFLKQGKTGKAENDFERAIRIKSAFAVAYLFRGEMSLTTGRYDRAIDDFNNAIGLEPDDPEVNNKVAWLRATCPEAKHRDGRLAIELATKACAATKWSNPTFLQTLAAAYAEAGKFDLAQERMQQAVNLGRDEASTFQCQLIFLFRDRQPYRLDVAQRNSEQEFDAFVPPSPRQ